MTTDRVQATYLIETPWPLAEAAETLAGEQSSGTFVAVPGETEELRERFRARLENVQELESAAAPSLPGVKMPEGQTQFHRARIGVSFSLENMGTNLPALVSTIAGNLFELREFSGLRLLDFELPQAFAEDHAGPQFGISGTRQLTGVQGRPIIGTIVKPSVGLTPAQTAELAGELAAAGVDFIKDDELMANPPHSPLKERVQAVMPVLNAHADRTGKKVMYAWNISDSLDAMYRHHDVVATAGGTCVMVSLNSVGLVGTEALRKHSKMPIHGHRNGWGMLSRHPALGIDFPAYQKLWRLVGVDQLHVNGLQNKFAEDDESVVRSIKACLKPFLGGYELMPVISSGQWGGQAPETYRQAGTVDLMYLAGGGIMAHPKGPAAGCRAIRQAWEAAAAGVELTRFAEQHEELRISLETFGRG
jgi:ribulose-bisphosphate carboxylase large chain